MNLQLHGAVARAAEVRTLSNEGTHSLRCKHNFCPFPLLDLGLDAELFDGEPVSYVGAAEFEDYWKTFMNRDFSGLKGISLRDYFDALRTSRRVTPNCAGSRGCDEKQ